MRDRWQGARPQFKFLKSVGMDFLRAWEKFFFEADAREQLRLFRPLFASVLFVAYVLRAMDSEFYYGLNGVMDLEKLAENFPAEYRWSFLIWFPSAVALWIHTGVFLISLITLGLGKFPRLSAAVAYLLHVSFMHRNMAVVYGFDTISVFFLFYLIFIKIDEEAARKKSSDWSSILTSAGFRMCQIQVCVIYAFSGWEKLKGVIWWRGEALWTIFNSQFARFRWDQVSHLPLLITVLTYATLLWEIYFPVCIWSKKMRPYVLLGGVLMHLGIGFIVIIPFFSALMITSYAVFLTPAEARAVLRRFPRYFSSNTQG